jgi:chloramphenicol-sensitive protein RarD
MRRGTFSAIGAYALWGLLPVYWKAVQMVPALEILAHRVVWSFVIVTLLSFWGRRARGLAGAIKNPGALVTFLATAVILGVNWLTYIWAVNAGYLVDASLGYYINPLFNVLLGVVFLGERLRTWQWISIGIAAVGVAYLTLSYGSFPWIALTLALTFGLYGLLRKSAPLGALEGLTLEMAVLLLPALTYLIYLESVGNASLGHSPIATSMLLLLTGVVTALPLLAFGYAARRVTLSSLGMMQYIAPTLQFLLGVLVYDEPFSLARLVGFSLIWLALLTYSLDGFVTRLRRKRTLVSGIPVSPAGD